MYPAPWVHTPTPWRLTILPTPSIESAHPQDVGKCRGSSELRFSNYFPWEGYLAAGSVNTGGFVSAAVCRSMENSVLIAGPRWNK